LLFLQTNINGAHHTANVCVFLKVPGHLSEL
jgi:hypothetical protein